MTRFGIFSGDGASPSPKPKVGSDKRVPLVAGVPMGAIIPRKFEPDPHLIMVNRPGSPIAERYRRLRLTLDQPGPGGATRQVIVVTSAVPEEGKTTTAINLALALAEDRDRRTLLVDADLRRPSVTRYLSPQPILGLSEVLTGQAPLDHAIIEVKSARLSILPAGAPSVSPLELLQSDYLASVFAELRRRFDRIIVDTPPTVPFTDAAVLNSIADGAILIVRARKTTRPLIERARASLAHGTLLGAVLNDVEFTPVDRYYYQYDDYNPRRYASRDAVRDRDDDGEVTP
jgi:receptor protein-tyrosine kinase/non-specific protein-tyrosine kinase